MTDAWQLFSERGEDLNITQAINGDIACFDMVISMGDSDYPYLVGEVNAVEKVGSEEHHSGNLTDDVFVDFRVETYSKARVQEIEAHFSKLYGEPKRFEQLSLDNVIMPPGSLICIEERDIPALLESRENAEAFCKSIIDGLPKITETTVADSNERYSELIERLNANLEDYHEYLLGCDKQELIDTASVIAAMNDTHHYLVNSYDFEYDEIEYLLQFQNPLEVCADKWRERTEDISDMSFSLDEVFSKRDAAKEGYALMADVEICEQPEVLPADKKPSIYDRLAAGKEKASAYKAQNLVTTKNKEEISI